ncbi:MAG: cytochrome c peroxidase [Gemmatales bacterium]|nr:cytochrome C peroxidase [Gemmatales bacterium]MDW8176612.1 cytochrome c peroxidase [Gemmatales bacterium]
MCHRHACISLGLCLAVLAAACVRGPQPTSLAKTQSQTVAKTAPPANNEPEALPAKPPQPEVIKVPPQEIQKPGSVDAPKAPETDGPDPDVLLPDEKLMEPFEQQVPVYFVNRTQQLEEWTKLPAFWNEVTEKAINPKTGQPVERKAVKIKVPLGLTQNPPVPPENPITVSKFVLGKKLYFSRLLSSDNTVSCSTCHHPNKGFTDQSPVSTGIFGNKGGVSAPTVMNSAYNLLQFWDGRAVSLEDQAQGPVQNPLEMWDGKGNAWHEAVKRLRQNSELVQLFQRVFGTPPTRDGAAKAIASYERLVLIGNSLHDRAELAMRERVEAAGVPDFTLQAQDYEKVLKEAFARKDKHVLSPFQLDPESAKDLDRVSELAKSIVNGRNLFFGKARCNQCHAGDNFTDNQFHNLGVGFTDGKLTKENIGRFGAQMLGHKDPAMVGAFKTPTLRGLLSTAPYMHDGSEKTLEDVINFYDRGGNANPWLDPKMRDVQAEQAFTRDPKNYKGPEVKLFDGKPIVPLKLNLTDQEKKDLANFLRALQSDPPDPLVADPARLPPGY